MEVQSLLKRHSEDPRFHQRVEESPAPPGSAREPSRTIARLHKSSTAMPVE